MNRICLIYQDSDGWSPYEVWLEDLSDVSGRAKIRIRIDRAAQGNLGDHRSVGGVLIELRIHFGPGYRLYIGQHGAETIVLLCGGDKSTQQRDIGRAQEYWNDYKRRL